MTDPIYAALGQFILTYSHAENALKQVIAHASGVTSDVGRALFSDQRLRPLIDRCRKVHEAKGIEIHPRIAEAFAQLASINDMRDKLLHQGFEYDEAGDQFFTTNDLLAYAERKVQTFPTSVQDLEDMTADLRRIQVYFMFWGTPFGEIEMFAKAFKELAERPREPWRYKSPSPIPKTGKSPRTRRIRLGQPPASQG